MLEVQLLGKFEVRVDDAPIEIPSRPAQSLLAYLILNAGKSFRREKLAGLLWPDSDETTARNNLRQTLWRLRKAIGDGYVVADKFSITFDFNADYNLDTATLENETGEAESVDKLICSLSVYEGRLLPGFYDDWVTLEAERLEAVFEDRIQMLLDRLTEEARWREVREWAERWVAQGQVPEPAYRGLMVAHARLGDRTSLMSVYQRCVEVLNTELGVEPSMETRELYQRLIKGEIPPQPNIEPVEESYHVSEEAHPTSFVGRAMEQQIRFCKASDGVGLAYATVGEGPALVRAATYLTHLEYDWTSPIRRHWLEGLSKHHTLVRYDQRGSGLSDWDVEDFSLDARVGDLEAVVDTLALDRFSLLGASQGGPVAIAYAVRHPKRVSHLILYGTYARGFFSDNPTPEQLDEAEMFLKLIKLGWGSDHPTFRQLFASYFLPSATPEQISWFNDLQRISTSPEVAARFQTIYNTTDVNDLAAKVTVPTLVLHARNDLGVPFQKGRQLAALIPNARLVTLEGKNHDLLPDEPAWPRFLAEVYRFIGTEAT